VPTPLDDALELACRHNDLSSAGARLIHHYSNAVYLLPAVPAIARIAVGADPARLRANQTVTGWLAREGFPATAPLDGAELVEVDEATTASFWTYYPQPEQAEVAPFTSGHLGMLIRSLHDTGQPGTHLTEWRALESLDRALNSPAAHAALTTQDRDWLSRRIIDVRAELADLAWPLGRGLIHGDAWAGNLLWDVSQTPNLPVLCDWDSVSHGPREVDLIPTWHAAVRYGRDESWIQMFVDQYGYDLRDWSGYDALLIMRDLAQLPGPIRRSASPPHAAALRQRLTAIRSGDRTSSWVAL